MKNEENKQCRMNDSEDIIVNDSNEKKDYLEVEKAAIISTNDEALASEMVDEIEAMITDETDVLIDNEFNDVFVEETKAEELVEAVEVMDPVFEAESKEDDIIVEDVSNMFTEEDIKEDLIETTQGVETVFEKEEKAIDLQINQLTQDETIKEEMFEDVAILASQEEAPIMSSDELSSDPRKVEPEIVIEKKKKQQSFFKPLVIVLLIVSLSMNLFLLYRDLSSSGVVSNNNNNSNSNISSVDYDINTDTTAVVEKVNQSVVGVAVYNNGSQTSSGSGVVYKTDGEDTYIITNHHVIEDANEIQVVFSNQESVNAELIGSDQYSDIAILRVQTDFETQAMDIGDSDLLKTGEPVLAIGSPLGIEYAGTVTQGIVSATDRVVSVDLTNDGQDDWEMSVIQTDAAINPGNSGGAFVNGAGELVGITTLKYSDTSVEGMGFALPINDVIDVANEIEETGKVSRPVLGITGVSLTGFSGYELSYYRIDTDLRDGIYVSSVSNGGAAQAAGMEEGDIITSFDGVEITTYKSFLTELYAKEPGQKVEIVINRQGTEHTLSVTLGG